MTLAELFLSEFDQEMASTRRMLERVPEGKPDWRPHPKSMTLGYLAYLLAALPSWATTTIEQDSLDIGGATPPAFPIKRKELLELFDKNVARARELIARTSDAEFAKPWSLLVGGRTVFTLPKHVVLRSSVLNHLVHHRAQFGVYLRLNEVPVPAVYGPSADEQGM